MQFHEIADLFPLIEGAEFSELVASIKANGLREPITVYQEKILDGRNRFRACIEANIKPHFVSFADDDPYAYVADMNLHRRHLKPGQRGLIAARMATISVGIHKSKSSDVGTPTSLSQADAGKLLGVSRDTVLAAKIILNEGTPEEIHSVESGEHGVGLIADKIRARNPRKRKGGSDQSHHANFKAARHTQKINGRIWQDFRAALLSFGNLPKPSDMAAIVRKMARGTTVDDTLTHAIEWLIEFDSEWNKQKKDAA